MNPNITKLIDQYLAGELSTEDKQVFEQRMQENETLRNEVELQQSIYEAAKRGATRQQVKRTGRHYHLMTRLKWGGLGVGILLLAAASVLAVNALNNPKSEEAGYPMSEELIRQLDAALQLEGLPTQYFPIPKDGQVVLSDEGVLLSVPEKAFLFNGKPYSGRVILQLQEALEASDIVKAGLSTMSGNRLLETQGMMAVQGFTTDGQKLDFNPEVGVYVQVPVDAYKSGMQLFTGVKQANGTVDWQNPQPLEKIPVSVDMADLDFYPAGYEDFLDNEKWKKGKRQRDSLYLSFENYSGEELLVNGISASEIDEENELGALVRQCATCHSAHQDGTGPQLAGVRLKWTNGNAKEGSIYQWVKDWELACVSDPYAKSVASIKPTNQPKFQELSRAEIDQIFDYFDMIPRADIADSIGSTDFCYEIAPSKVLAFWNQKFNRTNLATREFEQRMQAVFRTCNNQVLERYTAQLDKPLSEIDAEVVKMGYPEFERFAAEQVGKVQLSNKHYKHLMEFYEKATAQYRSSAEYAQEKERRRQERFDQDVQQKREAEQTRKVVREITNLNEEFGFNLRNVYKQLGKTVGFTIRGGSTSGDRSNGSGAAILNIDRYVLEATVKRQSTLITDPETGKTAQLTYNDFSFEVQQHERYRKLYAYLFPHQLNSYQRIEGEDGKFNYPLNDDILYDLAIVGLTKDGFEYFEKFTFKSGELGELALYKISEERMEASTRQLNNKRVSKPMQIQDELDWLFTERADYEEQAYRKDMRRFRSRIAQIVFPCNMENSFRDATDAEPQPRREQ